MTTDLLVKEESGNKEYHFDGVVSVGFILNLLFVSMDETGKVNGEHCGMKEISFNKNDVISLKTA